MNVRFIRNVFLPVEISTVIIYTYTRAVHTQIWRLAASVVSSCYVCKCYTIFGYRRCRNIIFRNYVSADINSRGT